MHTDKVQFNHFLIKMIPFTKKTLSEWESALCAAVFRSETFVSQRGKIANEDLRNQPGVTEPWNLKKGRTRNDVGKSPGNHVYTYGEVVHL